MNAGRSASLEASSHDSAQSEIESLRCRARIYAERHLGPASAAALRSPIGEQELRLASSKGRTLTDCTLTAIHHIALENQAVANEFLAYFMEDLLQLGHNLIAPGFRRLLDTEDLVQSVLTDLWPELRNLKFQTRGRFLSLLAQRLRWKVSSRARGWRAGRRREDLRVFLDDEMTPPVEAERQPHGSGLQSENSRAVERAFGRLPDDARRVLELHLEGRRLPEIARAMRQSEIESKKALKRAVRMARELFGREF